MPDDTFYMQRAIELAWSGIGRTSPNPMVGCVIVRGGEIVGEGYRYMQLWITPEVVALKQAGEISKGATAYITLEPCAHTGRTPPCVDALISARISRVVYGLKDPDPRVNGEGHARLESAGIKVDSGLLEDEIREQNKFYITSHEKGRPYVLAKWAMTANGKIATRTGECRWISSDKSLNVAHHLRNIYDSVLVGHSTVMVDDPALTCRVDLSQALPSELFPRAPQDVRNPQRIILDTFAATPGQDLQVYSQPGKTVVAVGPESPWDDTRSRDRIDRDKIEMLECPLAAGHIDLHYLLSELNKKGIQSILVEGGSGVHASFFEAGLVDEVAIIVAPKIFGGESALSPVGGGGIEFIRNAWHLESVKHFSVDEDLWINGIVTTAPGRL